MNVIVVGVDQSEQAKEALQFALEEAKLRNAKRRVVEGPPAGVLVNESRDADLLVVGSRGHGGFTDLLLGSVSGQVSHHAACPVVIVRQKAKDSD